MGALDDLKYHAKLFELENGRFSYYVYVCSWLEGDRWTQDMRVGYGSADSEASAIEEAQKMATDDRQNMPQGKRL